MFTNLKNLSTRDGIEIALAVKTQHDWINRRVESLSLETSGSTRRQVSFDFWIPEIFAKIGFIPLTPLAKKTLRKLNVTGESGNSISVLNFYETADLSALILYSAIDPTKVAQEPALEHITRMIDHGQPHSNVKNRVEFSRDELLTTFLDWTLPHLTLYFDNLAQLVLDGFLLWVKLPEDSKPLGRAVVKVSYEEVLPQSESIFKMITSPQNFFENFRKNVSRGFRGNKSFLPIQIETAVRQYSSARFHFEISAPNGFTVTKLALLGENHQEYFLISEDHELPRRVAHVATSWDKRYQTTTARFVLAPLRSGIGRVALYAAIALFSLLVIPYLISALVVVFSDQKVFYLFNHDTNGMLSLILAIPTALLTYVAARDEHPLLANILGDARTSLFISAGLLFASAIALTGVFPAGVFKILYLGILCEISIFNLVIVNFWYKNWAVNEFVSKKVSKSGRLKYKEALNGND